MPPRLMPGPVLVVDDDAGDRALVHRAFAMAQVRNPVIEFAGGSEVLQWLAAADAPRVTSLPVAMLLDLRMPGIDGLEVLRKVRSDSRMREVPVIIVTASESPRDMLASYASGANSYVVKRMDASGFAADLTRVGRYWCLVNEPPRE